MQVCKDSCLSTRITIEHTVAHVHTRNGLVESLVKHLQLISRSLLMMKKLFVSIWGHGILQSVALVRIRPTSYHEFSPLQLTFSHEPNISHLRIFGCVYIFQFSHRHTQRSVPKEGWDAY